MNSLLGVQENPNALSVNLLREVRSELPINNFKKLYENKFPFFRTTFWYDPMNNASNIIEKVALELSEYNENLDQAKGIEIWFSVMEINKSPIWLLPCHFDRENITTENTPIKHPEVASVFFLNTVPYGELLVTDQLLVGGNPAPPEPLLTTFVKPIENKYVIFPGAAYHGVVGRLWREIAESEIRVSIALNYWKERPIAPYLLPSKQFQSVFRTHIEALS